MGHRRLKFFQHGVLAVVVALLAACGGGDDAPVRGVLVEAPSTLGTISAAQIDASPLKPLTSPAKCDVKVVALNYYTVDPKGKQTNASAAMLVPLASASCPTTGEPLLV